MNLVSQLQTYYGSLTWIFYFLIDKLYIIPPFCKSSVCHSLPFSAFMFSWISSFFFTLACGCLELKYRLKLAKSNPVPLFLVISIGLIIPFLDVSFSFVHTISFKFCIPLHDFSCFSDGEIGKENGVVDREWYSRSRSGPCIGR